MNRRTSSGSYQFYLNQQIRARCLFRQQPSAIAEPMISTNRENIAACSLLSPHYTANPATIPSYAGFFTKFSSQGSAAPWPEKTLGTQEY